MLDYYIGKINKIKIKAQEDDLYKSLVISLSADILNINLLQANDSDIEILDKKNFSKFIQSLNTEYNVQKSPIDLNKLVYALQSCNRGALALQAFTKYSCTLCHKEDMWHNSLVPKFCKECATDLARNILQFDLNK